MAGIGNPTRFFDQLRSLRLTVIERPFPDHYAFKASDIDFGKDAFIIMTEKDAVKCQSFCDKRHWCFAVTAKLSEDFEKLLMRRLKEVQRHKLT